MVFRAILHELLETTEGAIGAMFLDYEGESVELLTHHDLELDDLKIIGAYQGIFLTQLRNLCSEMAVGEPQRFKLEFALTTVLSCDIKDGYYLVLLIAGSTSEGMAWHRLTHCREKLLAEM